MTNTIHSEGCNSTGAQGKQASQADEAARSLCRAGRKLAVPCAISTVTVSCSWLSSGERGVQPEMNIQKLVRQCPMLSSGLRMGSSPSPLSLHNISIWVLSILPCLSQALRNCTSAQCLLPPHRLPSSSTPPPPNAHRGVWGWPICDRSEVSSGLGKGASQRGTGGAGHTVGFLSNWKPCAQQNP